MPDWLIQLLLAAAPLISGATLYVVNRLHGLRMQVLQDIRGDVSRIWVKVDHTDECVDDLKEKIAVAVAVESRVMRLENRVFTP